MDFHRIPEFYRATGKTYQRGDYIVYPVKPNKGNEELDARVLLSWDKDWEQWVAYLEGIYGSFSGNVGKFMKGPFNLNSEATKRICKHYGFPLEFGNREGNIMLVSVTSPDWFKQIKENNKLKKNFERLS